MADLPRKSLIVKLPIPSCQKGALPKSLHCAIRPEVAGLLNKSASGPSNITEHFSQSQLAIAFSISKSKPPGLSTKDHLEQLRKHVKIGQRVPQDRLRYIDTSAFWKDQFTRLHLEKKAVEDEISCLKEGRRLLKKRCHDSVEQYASQEIKNGPVGIDGNSGQLPEDINITLVDDGYLRLSSYAHKLGRHRAALETTTIATNNLDNITTLTERTVQLLALLESTLPDCCVHPRLLKDTDGNARISFAFQQVMNQFALAFLACLTSVDDLCRTILGRAKRAEIVYRMVLIFKQGLDLLQAISSDQADHEETIRGNGTGHKRQRTVVEEYLVNKHLTKALAAISQTAQWKIQQPAHSEILEGLLLSTLQHIGRLVSEAVFGEHIAALNLPANITESIGPVVQGFVRPEARYIVQVLHAMVGVGNRIKLITQMLAAGKTSVGVQIHTENPSATDVSDDVLSKAKRLLQSTLVKSAVGGQDLRSLRLPTPPLNVSNVVPEDGVEIYGKDWLIEMVWGLVGWDIVCSK